MAEIKVLKVVDSSGFWTEHDDANDSIKAVSFKTANKELTDTKLGNLVDTLTGGSSTEAGSLHMHDGRLQAAA